MCAPLIARSFTSPVSHPYRALCFLAFIFSSLGIAPNAYLARHLMIKEKTYIVLIALCVSGIVAIIMAFNEFGYWALAWQQVIYNLMVMLGRFVFTRWHPTLHVNFAPIRQMFGFSVKVLVTTILNTISNNVLTVILGRMFPETAVGNYYQANKWNTMANSLVANTVNQVAQPVLTQITDEDDRQQRVFRKLLRFTAFLSFPAMFGLALIAPQFILIAIKDKWIDCVPLLQILCISGAFMPFYTAYQNLFLSRGRSDVYMWLSAGQIALIVTAVLACRHLGITAMVIAFAVITILWLTTWQLMARRLTGIRFSQVAHDILPFMVIAAVVMAITYLVTMWLDNIYLLLIARVAIAGTLYFLIMKSLHVTILEECLQFAKSHSKKSRQ